MAWSAAPPTREVRGYIQTRTARLEGKLALSKAGVMVDGRCIAWSEVLYVAPVRLESLTYAGQRLRFRNGEVWSVELLSLAGKQVEVRSDLFGTRKVDLAQIAALEFAPCHGCDSRGTKPGTLCRLQGEPIPGTLLSLTQERLGLRSLLGDLSLPRSRLARYVVSIEPPVAKAWQEIDEIALRDGSILQGRLSPGEQGLTLVHPLLGRLAIPGQSLRSIVRRSATLTDLTTLTPLAAQTAPLVLPSGPQPRVEVMRGDTIPPVRWVKGLRIEARTTVRYALPVHRKGKLWLAGVLGPMAGARGDARLRVRVDAKEVLDREVSAETELQQLSLELPAGKELLIEVDFGSRLRFPCGVLLGDPHLLLKAG